MIVDLYIILGLISGFIWGVSVILDKYWVMEEVENDILVTASSIIIAPILASPLLFLTDIGIPTWRVLGVSLVFGMSYTVGLYFYVLSLRQEDASVVSPMFRLSPVFTVILTAAFLNQILDTDVYLGIVFVLAGVLMVTIERKHLRFEWTTIWKALLFATISTFIFAVGNVILEIALVEGGAVTVFYWSRWGGVIPLILFLPSKTFRQPFVDFARDPLGNGAVSMGVSKSLEVVGSLFYVFATSLGPVAVVSTLAALESVFVIIIAAVLSIWSKNGVSHSRMTLLKRGIASVLVVIGVALISL